MLKFFILLVRLIKQKAIILFLSIAFSLLLIPFILFHIEIAFAYSVLAFSIYIIMLEILFRLYYRIRYKKKYEFIPRIPFRQITIEPHPYLPYCYKKDFFIHKDLPTSYPLNKDKNYTFGELRSNNYCHINGSRGDRDMIVPKPKDIFRINCLGASATANYIFYNNQPFSYPLELEKILKNSFPEINIEVNNCGTGGYTSAEILIKFLLDTIDTEPDIIVIYHGYNDLQPSLTDGFQSDYSHSRRNLGEVYHLYELASKIPNLPLAFWNFAINHYIFFTQDIGFTVLGAITKKEADITNDFKGLNTYKRNIEHIINTCMANNINIVLSTYCHYLYPEIKEDNIHLKYGEGVKLENEIIRKLASKYKLPLVDNDLLIPRRDKYFLDSIHFTPEGMNLLAKNISRPIVNYLREHSYTRLY